jgi:thiol:disulfide interchange protein DsbC
MTIGFEKENPVITRLRVVAGFAAASLVALCAIATAADVPPPAAAPDAKAAGDAKSTGGRLEDQIRARVEKRLSTRVSSVRKMPFGLYEVVAENEVFYVDAAVNYLVAGRVIDIKTHEDLTGTRRDEVLRVDFKSLPFDNAVKSVRGDGSRMLVVFADPNCPYCKRLEKDLQTLDNVTMYTFLYPILSPDSVDKSVAIWCATDRAAAWSSTMIAGKAPKLEGEACKNPVDDNLALGKKLQITATPTLVFSDGHRVPGAMPIDRVETLLAEASRGSPHTAAALPGVPSSAATN